MVLPYNKELYIGQILLDNKLMNIQSSGLGTTRPLNGLSAPDLTSLYILVKSVILTVNY